ncbi:DNA gyrase/topoisomerase IV subunit A [Nesterenkonia sphaerica]|uniref:DNA topoisomerase (ATP-hydrolyzing) n=1 Tax=Nesterenkonia sphaerica TaxID=1804988 RepID=A0A5R9AL02_9MICC|nr:DNA topoisomerase IV subunit A [Nesterenkonia sphaerica]TLP79479.1 DNA topoisomerase IV subunit A [Nesterenkonia sphaerica]
MARRPAAAAPVTPPENITDIDVSSEMETSFLEYAYSVIYSRALPDARDGLKPVQRRILYMMAQMGLRPEKGHVKSARVVGEVMGKLHPHGDSAIYDALVRMAQSWALRLPLVDGHGNFGSLDDGPAAPRYTEARMAQAALAMTADLDEDVVDFEPNYDNQFTQPEVLPSAFPNLLVNGASGIAVGMATNMAPHNLREVVSGARHLILHPEATLEDIMTHIPGPDMPSGGRITGLDGVYEAYRTGRGSFRIRAKASIEQVTARRSGIVITELPYMVGPETIIAKIKEAAQAKKLVGISDVLDLTDRKHGTRMVIELKAGFDPKAVLAQLYRYTPLETNFGINNVALVNDQPRTLGLLELLQVYVDHRIKVVRRRTSHRLSKRQHRLHLVEGLLVAILDIDQVIQIIRAADNSAAARTRLMTIFDLTELQADHILELRLRQLTRYSTLELEQEQQKLQEEIAQLTAILDSDALLRTTVADELQEVADRHGDDRRTELLDAEAEPAVTASTGPTSGKSPAESDSLEIPDAPCWVMLSDSGMLARTTDRASLLHPSRRRRHDVLRSLVATTSRGQVGAVTSDGRMVRLPVMEMPPVEVVGGTVNLNQGGKIKDFMAGSLQLQKKEQVVALVPLDRVVAVATAAGRVKRVNPDYPLNREQWEIITLKDQDQVVGASVAAEDDDELVFLSGAAQLLRFPASHVRPQGRTGSGVAGMKLSAADAVIGFSVVPAAAAATPAGAVVVTCSSGAETLEGLGQATVKVTDLAEFPAKGRATGGVRAHRFLRGEDHLTLGSAVLAPALAADRRGAARTLPAELVRRDGSGIMVDQPIDAVGSSPEALSSAALSWADA